MEYYATICKEWVKSTDVTLKYSCFRNKKDLCLSMFTLAQKVENLYPKCAHIDNVVLELEGVGGKFSLLICLPLYCLPSNKSQIFFFIFKGMYKLKETCKDAERHAYCDPFI